MRIPLWSALILIALCSFGCYSVGLTDGADWSRIEYKQVPDDCKNYN